MGEPDRLDLIRELRQVLGLFSGAMSISPKQAWEEAIDEVRGLRQGRCASCMENDRGRRTTTDPTPTDLPRSLGDDLAELERTNPEVARAARALDDAVYEISNGGSYRERARAAIRKRKLPAG